MAKNKLPQGWVETNIGSVGKIIHYGYTATSTKIDTGTKFLRITDIQNNHVDWNEVPFCKISEKEKPNFLLHENDIVFARTGGTVGKSFLIKKNIPSAIFASYLIRVVLTEYTNPKFIHLFFQSGNYWHQIQQNKTGLKTNVNAQILSKLVFQLPPLNEQKKIVNKIETIFSMINFEQQTLEKTANTLELYRRSLLKKIFNKVTNRVPLSSISKINPYPEKNKFPDELDVTFIPMKNVEAMTGNINSSIVRKFKDVRKGYTFFEEGDLLFAKITPCMENGKIALARGLVNKIGFGSTEFHVIQFKDKEILPKFYFWYLIQDEFRNVAQRNMKGTAGQLRVSTDYMKNIFVPYTSKSEQNKIIIEIENSITKLKKQQDLIRFSLEKICLLKKSILKHAFEGKLIPQDPDDEPAGILLEKIKQNKITKC